jgi:serine/threonine-protein kinase
MRSTMSWYQTLAWKFFLRQAVTVLALVSALLWAAYHQAGVSARNSAGATLAGASQMLERTLDQQGRILDGGLEVFTQYSGNIALVEEALETGDARSLVDDLNENLPRLGAGIAIVLRPSGKLLACTTPGAPAEFSDVGILQMALAPEEARRAGRDGPFYRGFLRVGWGPAPGVYHAVARPLRSPGGGSLGAILVGSPVDSEAAAGLRREAVAPARTGEPPAQLALLSHFQTLGTTLPRTGPLDRFLGGGEALAGLRSRLLEARRSPVLPLELEGRSYLGMVAPLHGVNALDLEMASVLLLPTEPLLAPFRALQRAILGLGVAGILLALWLGLRSARSVTAPLQSLAAAAAALAEGEMPESLPPVASEDEVGVLTRTFRSMLAELQAKDDLLALLAAAGRAPSPTPSSQAITTGSAGMAWGEVTGAGPGREDAEPAEASCPPQVRPGEVFASRYRVEEVLGLGGMGVVLKVWDLQLEEYVALKVVREDLARNPGFLDQLKQEIRLARRISHRFVMRTHDFGESGGVPFVTMEYLKGVTLQALLDSRGRLPIPLVLRIARQVAEGLEAAHAAQVVHRDIKPANVLFDMRGDVKIMDFGLAAPARGSGEGRLTAGTPRYMSPEQIQGDPPDARSDLYALGILTFELCAGTPPYDSPRLADLLNLHLEAPIPSLRSVCAEAPEALSLLVARLMAKARGDRPQSASEVGEVLKALLSGFRS